MPFCQHCGSPVDQLPETIMPAAAADSAVEIARIEAERDVKVAQINARSERDWNETRTEVAEIEAGAEVAAAEATAEIIGEVIAAEADGADETEPETETVIVTAEPDDGAEDMAPPIAESRIAPKGKAGWSFA